jgi:hypothetical protein
LIKTDVDTGKAEKLSL